MSNKARSGEHERDDRVASLIGGIFLLLFLLVSGYGFSSAFTAISLPHRVSKEETESAGARMRHVSAVFTNAPRTIESNAIELTNEIVKIQIAGNILNIPREYFMWHAPESGVVNNLLIYSLFPNMTALASLSNGEIATLKGHSNILIVHIMDASRRPTLQYRLSVEQELFSPFEAPSRVFGLEKFDPKNVDPHSIRARREIYILRKADVVSTYITCDLKEYFPDPGCYQEFYHKSMLISLTYGKNFIPRWEKIQTSVEHLLDQFSPNASLIRVSSPYIG